MNGHAPVLTHLSSQPRIRSEYRLSMFVGKVAASRNGGWSTLNVSGARNQPGEVGSANWVLVMVEWVWEDAGASSSANDAAGAVMAISVVVLVGYVSYDVVVGAASGKASPIKTKLLGLEGGYSQVSSRSLQRLHDGVCLPHFLLARAQVLQAGPASISWAWN